MSLGAAPAAPVWWKRWPVWAGAAAIFLLGLSAGMLIERSRAPGDRVGAIETSDVEAIGAPSRDDMAKQPLVDPYGPSGRDDDAVDPDAPGSPADDEDTPDPFAPTPPPHAAPSTAAAFLSDLTDIACDKLVACGRFPRNAQGPCKALLADVDRGLGSQIAAGRCELHPASASDCLRLIEDLDCGRVSMNTSALARLLAGPLFACTDAISCR